MRKLRTIRRRTSPATAISIAALVIALSGTAYAATGGTFILGRANHETSMASMANSKGTPLALMAPARKAPLAVNRNVMIKNLNAQYLGGLTATGLAETGGEGFTAPSGTGTPIDTKGEIVASTGKLPAGTYYVSATADLAVATGDIAGSCWIAKGSAPAAQINTGTAGQAGHFAVAETAAVPVTAGDTLVEICVADGSNGSVALDAGIIAIRVLSSSHK